MFTVSQDPVDGLLHDVVMKFQNIASSNILNWRKYSVSKGKKHYRVPLAYMQA